MTRLFTVLKLSILGLLLLAVLACSSPEEAATTEPLPIAETVRTAVAFPPPPPVEPAPSPLAFPTQPESRKGGSLTMAAMADFPHRDVHQEEQETLTTLGPGLAYSRLMRLNLGQERFQPSLSLECDLCESWKLTSDMAYEFRLRPGILWHNVAPVNGRPLIAEDLAYSYDRMRTPGWPGALRFADRGIGEIQALDNHTLRVQLNFLDSDSLLALANGNSKIVAQEVVKEYGDLKSAPVIGTGPWVWEEPEAGVSASFSRNPDYFEKGLPYLDQLTVRTVKSPSAPTSVNQERLALFRAHLVDVMVVPPTDWEELRNSSQEFNARISQQPEIGVVMSLNTQTSPLNNLSVRQAIFRAVDPWEYVDLNWAGQGGVGVGMPLPHPDWQLTRSEMHADYLASPSDARDILQANYIYYPLPIELQVANLGPDYRKLGQQVAEDLRRVGFAPTVRMTSPADFQVALFGPDRDHQILLGPLPPHSTTNSYLYALMHSNGPGNVAGHQDEALNALIERQASELNPKLRRQQLLDLQRHILEKGYMFSPVTGSYRWVFNWDVKGFYPNTALSEYHYWSKTWLQ